MLELIKYDLVNGTKTSHEDVEATFANYEEMEEFRKKLIIEHPDHEVYLTYQDKNITKKENNGKTERTT